MTAKKRFVTGLIAGAAIGAAAGVLLAPKPGKVTRRFVSMRATRMRHRTGSYVTSLRRKLRRGDKVAAG